MLMQSFLSMRLRSHPSISYSSSTYLGKLGAITQLVAQAVDPVVPLPAATKEGLPLNYLTSLRRSESSQAESRRS
jgi:hypothetical protein